MSTTSKLFYAVICDYPGCGAMDDGGDFTYWADEPYAISNAIDGDWLREADDGEGSDRRIFCDGHAEHIVWLSDEDPGPMASGQEDDARILTLPDGERVVLE